MRKIFYLFLLGFNCLIWISPAEARPVSYPGAWTLMQMNDNERNSLHIHYSPTANYSIGYKGSYWRLRNYQTHSFQLNNLLKRYNGEDSQANLYLKNAVGVAYDTSGDRMNRTEPHFRSGIAMDWENRRYFVGYENEYHYSGQFSREYMQTFKTGFAPYLGEYGDLHTWLMLKVEHEPESDDPITVTPFIRFFKDVYLIEIGISEDKDIMANLIIRF